MTDHGSSPGSAALADRLEEALKRHRSAEPPEARLTHAMLGDILYGETEAIIAGLRASLQPATPTAGEPTPTKEEFAKWSRVWHDTCNTMTILLGLPGHGSPQEMLAQVQAYASRAAAATPSEPPIPLADHDDIGRKVVGQPWAIQAAIVTICAHCTVLVDNHPTGMVADLAGCISEQCLELANALSGGVAQGSTEACAKVADDFAAYEQTVIDRANADDALSETGRKSIISAAGARQVAAEQIAHDIRALVIPSTEGKSHD